MDIRKKFKRAYYSIPIMTLCMFAYLWGNVSRVSADSQIPLGIMGIYFEDELLYTQAAVGIVVGDEYFVCSKSASTPYDEVYYSTNDNLYLLEYYLEAEEYGLTLWSVYDAEGENAQEDVAFLEPETPIQKEEVSVIYYGFDEDGIRRTYVTSSQILDYSVSQDEMYYNLQLRTYPDENVGTVRYPAVILNDDGYCVGFLLDDGNAYCLWLDEELFYGTPSDVQQEPDTNETPDLGPDINTNVTVTPTPEPLPIVPKPLDLKTMGLMIVGIFGVLLVVLLIVVWTIKRKKVSKETNVVTWLVSGGGYMEGSAYPITDNGLVIGRDPSSDICYPANTPGVSRKHAQLYWENNRLFLMDCNSTNGTYVKRLGKIESMQPVEVTVGDVICIGEEVNSFEIKN